MLDLPALDHALARRRHAAHRRRARVGDAAAGDDYGFIVLRRGDVTRRIPYEFSVERPGLESVLPVKLQSFQTGDTRSGGEQGERLPLADRALRPGGELQRPARRRGRRREALRHRPQPAGGQHRRRRRRPVRQLADRPVVPRLARRERRHGLRGHAGQRERLPLPLPGRRPGRRAPVPAARASTTSPSTPGTTSSPAARSRGGTSCAPGSTTSARRWRSMIDDDASPPGGRRSSRGRSTSRRASTRSRS